MQSLTPIRCAAALFCVAVAVTPENAPPRSLDHNARHYADAVAERFRTVIHTAAAMDPDTGAEDKALRKARRRRQKELRGWLADKGRRVRRRDCTTEKDKAAYDDHKRFLGSARFLDLPFYRRRKAVATMAPYLDALHTHLPQAISNSLAANPPSALAAALLRPPEIEEYYFGAGPTGSLLAVYLPLTNTVYLNLNAMADAPDDLLDTFEHELTHQLFPGTDARHVARNPWFEGFNEAVAETWTHHLHQLGDLPDPLAGGQIVYPAQTALASLALAIDPGTVFRLAADATGRDSALAALTAAAAHSDPSTTSLHTAIAGAHSGALALPPPRLARITAILRDWNWRADDRGPLQLDDLVKDGVANPAELNRQFRINRPFYNDILDAWSIVLLQDLTQSCPDLMTCAQQLPLVPALRDNLVRVLRHTRDPSFRLPPR